jgi:hypothetical protein
LSGSFPLVSGREQASGIRREAPVASIDGASQILREQFAYLLEHRGACTSYCSDCVRFRRVAEILMEPFRSEPHAFKQGV